MSKRNTGGLVLFTCLAVVALMLGPVVATGSARAAIKTGLLLASVLPVGSSGFVETVTPPPIYEQIRYPAGSTQIVADIYRPPGTDRHGAVIFVPGMTSDFYGSPIVQASTSLARVDIVVMIPHLNGIQRNRLLLEDVDAVVMGFQYLQGQAFVDPTRVGLAGFCVGSSIALVAAEDSRINERVAFVYTFGGYYNLIDYFVAIATSRTTYKGQEQPWHPGAMTITGFAGHIFDALDDPRDKEIISQSALRGDLKAGSIPPGLSPLGRTAYGLLTTQDPDEVKALMGQIPKEKLEPFIRLSPSSGIQNLRAPVYIMHDLGDTGVPYMESRRLADSLPEGQRFYSEFTIFEHVYPAKPSNTFLFAEEVLKLYQHLYRVMERLSP